MKKYVSRDKTYLIKLLLQNSVDFKNVEANFTLNKLKFKT